MDMNKWLRIRVGAQAFTVVALCGYAYRQGALRKQTAPEEEAKKAKRESEEFRERLRGAEEAFRAEGGEVKGGILGEVERLKEGRDGAERARVNKERVERDGSAAGSEGVEAPTSTSRSGSGSSWKSWFGLGGGGRPS